MGDELILISKLEKKLNAVVNNTKNEYIKEYKLIRGCSCNGWEHYICPTCNYYFCCLCAHIDCINCSFEYNEYKYGCPECVIYVDCGGLMYNDAVICLNCIIDEINDNSIGFCYTCNKFVADSHADNDINKYINNDIALNPEDISEKIIDGKVVHYVESNVKLNLKHLDKISNDKKIK